MKLVTSCGRRAQLSSGDIITLNRKTHSLRIRRGESTLRWAVWGGRRADENLLCLFLAGEDLSVVDDFVSTLSTVAGYWCRRVSPLYAGDEIVWEVIDQ